MSTLAARVTAPTIITLTSDEPTPQIQSNYIEVQILLTGICGSDVHNYIQGDVYPVAIFGHEWVGVIRRVGDGVTDLRVGDRVTGAVGPACGSCAPCQAGHPRHCQTALLEGIGMSEGSPSHGAFAQRLVLEQRRVIKILDNINDVQAAMIEPATVTYHAVKRTHQPLGAVVVIQGAGPIGLLTAQHARHAGAGKVVILEPNEGRRASAKALGFTDVFEPGDDAQTFIQRISGGIGADVLYECAGVASILQASSQMLRRGGTLSLIGVASATSEIDSSDWLQREIRILGSMTYNHEDFVGAMRAIADGSVNVTALHSSSIGLHDLGTTLSELASGDPRHVKVLVDPNMG